MATGETKIVFIVLMDIVANPRVIAHIPQDHRHVTPQELKTIPAYNVIMNKPNTSILDFAMDRPEHFLKSTSRWTELHILAFRCLFLENLPISRILPQADIPDDNDPTMKLVIQHLSDSEDDIRSGRSALSLGPATSFYAQLQVVLRRPGTPPSPIPIPRTIRPASLTTSFPTIPESLSSSDSSYKPSPESSQLSVPPLDVPMRPRSSMEMTDNPLRPRSSMDISDSPQHRASIDSNDRSRSSMETNRSVLSSNSGSSIDEDKLETASYQAVASLLVLLCTFEQAAHPNQAKRLSFRFSTIFNPPLIYLVLKL